MRRLLLVICLALLALPSTAHGAFPGADGKIAFTSTRDEPNPAGCAASCNYEIYTMNPDGNAQTRLTNDPGIDREPTWSPDGTKIAFLSNRDGDFEIYLMSANGTGLTKLTNNAATDHSPKWSPDGTKIAFLGSSPPSAVCDPGDDCLLVMNADGSFLTPLAVTANSFTIDWSPDSRQLTYGYYDDALYKINADGTGKTAIGGGARFSADPDWSPKGEKIVFWSYYLLAPGNQLYGLWFADPGGAQSQRVPATGSDCEFPVPEFSPSGEEIAFNADPGCAGVDIYKINSDGTGPMQLTHDATNYGPPTWSPTGTRLAAGHEGDIYAIEADGSGRTQLTNQPGLDTQPDWQPLRALAPFPRPGGGSPLITYLVPAYEQCTSPNSQHVAPLAQGSCTPPVQASDLLTTSKVGYGKGFVRLDVTPGIPATDADEADVRIEADISDVRNASDQSDYSGQVLISSTLRITDRASGFGGVSATVSDFRFDVPVDCTPSAPAPNGSDCQILTTADTLVPGMVVEGKRSVVSTFNFNVLDAGLDGDVTPASGCPPTCGTGDEERYLEQGTFTP